MSGAMRDDRPDSAVTLCLTVKDSNAVCGLLSDFRPFIVYSQCLRVD